MVLQVLTSFIYNWVEASWLVSTILIKYFLLGSLIYVAYRQEDLLQDFNDFILDYSKETVTGILVLGLLVLISGLNFSPVFENFSSLVAFTYYGYLFWKF